MEEPVGVMGGMEGPAGGWRNQRYNGGTGGTLVTLALAGSLPTALCQGTTGRAKLRFLQKPLPLRPGCPLCPQQAPAATTEIRGTERPQSPSTELLPAIALICSG